MANHQILDQEEEDIMSLSNRRRIKNRLHQRACRARRRLLKQRDQNRSVQKWTIYTCGLENTNEEGCQNGSPQSPVVKQVCTGDDDCLAVCRLDPSGKYELLSRLRAKILFHASRQILRCDLLPSVTQYNAIYSMFCNSKLIGLSPEHLDLDIDSPFTIPCRRSLELPDSLQPTVLQKLQSHHPWIDLLPIPRLRDTILRYLLPDELDRLCCDLFGKHEKAARQAGLIVWGESWDPSAYEVSELVFTNWPQLLRHCPELVYSTNIWRSKRGEQRLSVVDQLK